VLRKIDRRLARIPLERQRSSQLYGLAAEPIWPARLPAGWGWNGRSSMCRDADSTPEVPLRYRLHPPHML
jgi:hypothetical protein